MQPSDMRKCKQQYFACSTERTESDSVRASQAGSRRLVSSHVLTRTHSLIPYEVTTSTPILLDKSSNPIRLLLPWGIPLIDATL